MRVLVLSSVAAAALVAASALPAQQTQQSSRVHLTGHVIDAGSGQPLRGVAIFIDGLRLPVITDETGKFVIPSLKPGRYLATIERIGYHTHHISLSTSDADDIEILLTPDPIKLEAITVLHDRIRSRRNAVPVSVRAYDQQRLATATSMQSFLGMYAGLNMSPCRNSGFRDCAWVRGRFQPVSVVIDERPAFGLSELDTYQPSEFYLIEVYAGGAHVRAYTKWFVERLANAGGSPMMPILWW